MKIIILLLFFILSIPSSMLAQTGYKTIPAGQTGLPAPMIYDSGDPITLGYACGSSRTGIPFYNMIATIVRPLWLCNGTSWVQALPNVTGATASFGGSALLLGGSVTSTASVANTPVGSNCIATRADGTLLAVGLIIDCAVATTNVATVRISAAIAGTPAAGIYNVRAFP